MLTIAGGILIAAAVIMLLPGLIELVISWLTNLFESKTERNDKQYSHKNGVPSILNLNFKILTKKFNKQKNVIFITIDNRHYVRILKNDQIYKAYELCFEAKNFPNNVDMYNIVDERDRFVISSDETIKNFNESLKSLIDKDLSTG